MAPFMQECCDISLSSYNDTITNNNHDDDDDENALSKSPTSVASYPIYKDAGSQETTITTTTTRRHRRQPRKRVRFHPLATIRPIRSLRNYTADEKQACWYDADEEYRIRTRVSSEARLSEIGLLVESADVSLRGLECRTRTGVRRKSESRRDAYDAVFQEIWDQHHHYHDAAEEHRVDDEVAAIAAMYALHSESCALEAQKMARQDDLDALAIYAEDDDCWHCPATQ